MKKTILILLCLSLVFAACGTAEEETVEEPAVVEEDVETLDSPAVTTAEVLDKITLPFMRVEMPYNDVPENFILIKPGDMLWTIAYRLYGDPFKYIQIFEENKDQITNPDLIFPERLNLG